MPATSASVRDPAQRDGIALAIERPQRRRWLHVLSVLLVLGMFGLIAIGGNVTSLGAGLAVPDGWMTFEYFTPLAPLHTWWHDIGTRWEHSHRLKGYLVGGLTIAVVLGVAATQRRRRWLVWTSVALLLMVIAQGVMGALRVDLARITPGEGYTSATGEETTLSLILRIVHGVFGQVVLGVSVLVAAALGPAWQRLRLEALNHGDRRATAYRAVRTTTAALIALLLVQLVLGATVRHMGAGLAIPDFPLNYGQVIPPLTQAGIDTAALQMPPDMPVRPATPAQVAMQFSHRVGAVVVTLLTAIVLWQTLVMWRVREWMVPAAAMGVGLVVQWLLGMYTIWTTRNPTITTLHQATGAALLAVTVLLTVRVYLVSRAGRPAEVRPTPQAAPSARGQLA